MTPILRNVTACQLLLWGMAVALSAVTGVARAQISNTQNTVYVIAGGTEGSSDGIGPAAQFSRDLYGVTANPDGNLYVVDATNCTVRKITPAGAVSTLAGSPGVEDSADGVGSAAHFRIPIFSAVDSAGVLYIADQYNHTIRKVTTAGVVTTLAGVAGSSGHVDGIGAAARFASPTGIAVDSAGNVYVSDSASFTIRKITPAGSVSTVAGTAYSSGSSDGPGASALFWVPLAVATDGGGNVYVSDTLNRTIRKITPSGNVSTLAGAAGMSGTVDATGAAARFEEPLGLTADGTGNLYVADSNNIRKITPAGAVTSVASYNRSMRGVTLISQTQLAVTTAGYNVIGINFASPIQYTFTGFLQPVDNLPVVNTVKAGSAIPVKFSLGGDKGLNIFASGFPASQGIACSSGAPTDAITETANPGSSTLSYDTASDRYVYVWKTEKAWADTCRRLTVKLADGSEHPAIFRFK